MYPIPNWIILLIGGSSGTGKSTLSPIIANQYKAELARVDDFRMALQSVTKPESHPELHFFINSPGIPKLEIWKQPPDVLCEALIKIGKLVSSALEVVIDHHVNTRNRLVLEGDGIIPDMVSKMVHKYNEKLRSVFLFEPDKEFFFNKDISEEANNSLYQEKMTVRMMHWLYSKWLVKEARERDLPIVQSRPWETLYDRVLSTIE